MSIDIKTKVVQHVPRIILDNLTLLSIDMKTKVVQHVSRIIFNVFKVYKFSGFQVFKFSGSQRLSDFQTFFSSYIGNIGD